MTRGRIIETRLMDNPMATDGLVDAKPEAAKSWATINLNARIGGLAFIRAYNPRTGKGKRMPHHDRAAERFLSLYEARYGRTSAAVDPEREPVDTSPMAHDSGMAGALDATRAIEEIEIGIRRDGQQIVAPVFHETEFRFLVAVLCLGMAIMHYTETQGRALEKEVDRFLVLLDRLSEHWGLMMEKVA